MKSLLVLLMLGLPQITWAACDNLLCHLSEAGVKCKKATDGELCTLPPSRVYSQPIAILIPEGVKNPEQIILHLHGIIGRCEPKGSGPERLNSEFHFLSQLEEHGSNSIMVMPMSTFGTANEPQSCSDDRRDTYNKELLPNFGQVLARLKAVLHISADATWQLTAHSGGGTIASKILAQNPGFAKKVVNVAMMDASSCAKENQESNWSKAYKNGKFRVHSRYVAYRAESSELASHSGGRYKSSPSSAGSHCDVPKRDFGSMIELGSVGTSAEEPRSERGSDAQH